MNHGEKPIPLENSYHNKCDEKNVQGNHEHLVAAIIFIPFLDTPEPSEQTSKSIQIKMCMIARWGIALKRK
jgi:hypothetical protein